MYETIYVLTNPFLANVSISYPMKTPKTPWFPGVFKGYKMGTLAKNGLLCVIYLFLRYALLLYYMLVLFPLSGASYCTIYLFIFLFIILIYTTVKLNVLLLCIILVLLQLPVILFDL